MFSEMFNLVFILITNINPDFMQYNIFNLRTHDVKDVPMTASINPNLQCWKIIILNIDLFHI